MKIIISNPNTEVNAKFKMKALAEGVIAIAEPIGAMGQNENNEWLVCLAPALKKYYPSMLLNQDTLIGVYDESNVASIFVLNDNVIEQLGDSKIDTQSISSDSVSFSQYRFGDIIFMDTYTGNNNGISALAYNSESNIYDKLVTFNPPLPNDTRYVYVGNASADGTKIVVYTPYSAVTNGSSVVPYTLDGDSTFTSAGAITLDADNLISAVISPDGTKIAINTHLGISIYTFDGVKLGDVPYQFPEDTSHISWRPFWLNNDVVLYLTSISISGYEHNTYLLVIDTKDDVVNVLKREVKEYIAYTLPLANQINNILFANARTEEGDKDVVLIVDMTTGKLIKSTEVEKREGKNGYLQSNGERKYRALYIPDELTEDNVVFETHDLISCSAGPAEHFSLTLDETYMDKTLVLGYKVEYADGEVITDRITYVTSQYGKDPYTLFFDLAVSAGLLGETKEPVTPCVNDDYVKVTYIDIPELGNYNSVTYGTPTLNYVLDGIAGTVVYDGGYIYKNAANHNNVTEARAYYEEFYQQFADGLIALGFDAELVEGAYYRTANIGNYNSYAIKISYTNQFSTVELGGNGVELGTNGPTWTNAEFNNVCVIDKSPFNSPAEYAYEIGGVDIFNGGRYFVDRGLVLTIDTCANLGIELVNGEVDIYPATGRTESTVIASCGRIAGG